MKRWKRIISILTLSSLVIASLAACSSSDSSTPENTTAESAAAETVAAEVETVADEISESDVSEDTASDETVSSGADYAVSDEAFAQYLTEVKTSQYFTDDPVPEEDIEIILNAGMNAESGMNQQNWHFSAISNKDVQMEIWNDLVDMMPALAREDDTLSNAMIADAPLAIIISYGEGPGTEYDAGLATESMNTAALALGYGTKIIASPTLVLNGEKQDYYRTLLGIPEDKTAVGALLVGLPLDTSDMDPDTISAASTRNSYSEMTSIIE